MVTFSNLPSDTIFHIIDQIERECDISSLCLTSRAVHRLASPYFYSRHVRLHNSWALCWAAFYNRVDTARLVLAAGGDLYTHLRDYYEIPPFALTARSGSVEMIRFLLGVEGVDPDWADLDEFTPLIYAASMGRVEVVRLLLADPRVDPTRRDCTGETAFTYTIQARREKIIQLLLHDGRVDPSIAGNLGRTPLMVAAASELDNSAVLGRLLADPRVDVHSADNWGATALHGAVRVGKAQHVKLLLDAGADGNARDSRGDTPLHEWAQGRDDAYEALELLLAAPGIDVNAAGDDGHTVLMIAAETCKDRAVSRLLRDGRVLVNTTAANGMTALMMAARAGDDAVVRALLGHPGIDVNLGADRYHFLLHYAIVENRYSAVMALLEDERVDTSSRYEGTEWTPFLCAAACGRADVARLLYESGRCGVYDRDVNGRNAYELAEAYGKHDVMHFLCEIQDPKAWRE